MSEQPSTDSSRILIIDDNAAIHNDFRKILGAQAAARSQLDDVEKALFGNATVQIERSGFRIDSAYQGQEALAMVQHALQANDPYAMAFVDVRMPPGWDGIETLERLWKCAPELQAVICTAYSDYSWDDITRRFGQTDSLLILKKPFDTVEVLQLAHALTKKWALARQARLRLEDLDRMVGERTRELQAKQEEHLRLEAQLRQAQKMEAIGCLSAGVAHEFNNLLTVIQGHADLLRGKPADTRMAGESVERITQASQRAASLTRQLLAFSRKQPMQFKPVQLSTTVQRLRKMLGQLIAEPYQLCLECAVPLPAIRADEGNMEQILINLVLNARDAMPKGGAIRIRTSAFQLDEAAARLHPEARPGQFVCLTVTDTGCGMAPELLGRIFDPFFTTKEVGKGTGLGLSTVHGIVRQHQGWIQVTSQLGQGSSFQVFLPVWEGAPESGPTPLSTLNSQLPTPLPRGAGETVLLVEDESSVRRLARLALERG
ncbi:MAG TPA: ATP-binding protein, partial [Candidatus Sulfotelmatobacter sp.]|nr:ATP-binding protein [Candidatus Sulfotelmatobacter sp.]